MVKGSLRTQEELFVHPLAYVRAQHGWTYQDLVDVIARRVGNMATRREKAWRWEHWGVKPDEAAQCALAAELGVPSDRVEQLGWPAWLPAGDQIDLALPWTAQTSLTLLERTAGAALLDRRAFLTLSAGTLLTTAHQWLTTELPRTRAALDASRVDAGVLVGLEQRLSTIRQAQFALGGESVRHLADAELRLVNELLIRGSSTQPLARGLFAVAAELGRVAGWSSVDAGFLASAERYFTTALHASHAAGDRASGANILKCMSLQLMEADRPKEALEVAAAARKGAKQAPPRVVAMMTVREARAYAVLDRAKTCEELLVQAEAAMSRADAFESPDWAAYFDQAEYCAQVASCYLMLGRHRITDHWLDQSLRLQPPERRVDQATYLMWRAEAMLGLGDLDHACSLIREAVPSIAIARSARNRRRLVNLHGRLRAHQHTRVVAELDEQMRPLLAKSA